MKLNYETSFLIQYFVQFIETLSNKNFKIFCYDNDPEFSMKIFHLIHGIQYQTYYPDIPLQNGIVERKHIHLLHVTRALIFQSHLP